MNYIHIEVSHNVGFNNEGFLNNQKNCQFWYVLAKKISVFKCF